ncbi:ketol-acid reductoisomerase [Enterobacteriaceae endosymbiont of Plateumaris consimilis]|uniref:ketol-acid reductoisomerase n=1 Tax=Enterobacteriaceae endosymbiont of Plateumaris consimilis TaxID=2675794 RepID=UPI001449F043|nr:ketol-acid reductoisomerase [Enterobacteriaceae endosymbiont of Plateumaris consimilis]QJC28601.1 ketol-acid reductoisomerase [Enterobacteriaceae endosymbiont of Plateumaris consimilis]
MKNYFNELNFREKLKNLQKCRLMNFREFLNGINYLKNKKIVIIGCGAQGLNQGLNMRDSGLNISYALKKKSIKNKNLSWEKAYKNKFIIGSYNELIPSADLIINLTPDKNHSQLLQNIKNLIKPGATLGYSHGFNIVEEGEKIPKNINVIMVAPKCPGTEVREEYKRGFGVPSLIAVHQQNNYNNNNGLETAKAWAVAIGSHKAGILESSFIAEVKSDLMGEQTVLCGMLQTASIILFNQLINRKVNKEYASQFIQFGWEYITESLKQGGITLMMDRLNNKSKIRAYELSLILKKIFKPLFRLHMDNIISGNFSKEIIEDWNNDNKNLLNWRKKIRNNKFEQTLAINNMIHEQEIFDRGLIMVAIVKASVELSYEIMIETGISPKSAYYESLHELPLIANTIARKKLYEMNKVISDTAEYGNYLFSNKAMPLLENFMNSLQNEDLGIVDIENISINNKYLLDINLITRNHSIEKIGYILRKYMTDMKCISK